MRVRATQDGLYLRFRRAGEEFDIPERHFTTVWMQPIEGAKGPADTQNRPLPGQPSPPVEREPAAPPPGAGPMPATPTGMAAGTAAPEPSVTPQGQNTGQEPKPQPPAKPTKPTRRVI